ncbi:hypothetical protein, partial [Fusobacterium sp.]|uniref:hypothetical protein n=1 Tax=Fusobacterium sp. TaxID=68766 RepID=UPI00396CD873
DIQNSKIKEWIKFQCLLQIERFTERVECSLFFIILMKNLVISKKYAIIIKNTDIFVLVDNYALSWN